MQILYRCLFLGLFTLVGTSPGLDAQPFREQGDYGAQTFQLGGSAAAVSGGLDGFLANPATLAHFAGRGAISGGYHILPKESTSWNVGIVDGTSGIVGGFQFQSLDQETPNRQTYSVAGAYQSKLIWVGIAGHIFRFSKVTSERGYHFTGSSGIFLPVYSGFSIGAFTRSILDREKDQTLPPRIHVGLTYSVPKSVRLTVDGGRELNSPAKDDWNISSGGELTLHESVSITGGYHWNRSNDESFWAVGANYIAPKLELKFAYHRTEDTHQDGYSFEGLISF